jgi:phospholipase C
LVFGQRSISQPDNYRQDKEQEMMTLSPKSMRTTTRLGLCASAAVIATFAFGLNVNADDDNARHDGMRTRTPIKHVIVIIGENRSFDHVFGLYEPKHGQRIANLLSKGIVKEDGTPGPNFAKAAQFTVLPQPTYFISAPVNSKTPYIFLPPPDLNGTPAAQSDTGAPFKTVAEAIAAEPGLEQEVAQLLTTGASGLATTTGPDVRVPHASSLPNGPFQLTSPTLPYDSYHGDTIHRFFQMWQQSDCDVSHATPANPSGCLNDLYPFVVTTFSKTDQGGGNSMAFLNVQQVDAPVLKRLADEFTSSDNFHQAVQGGTGANHIMLGTGDAIFFSDGHGNALPPPPIPGVLLGLPPSVQISLVANPDPVPGTNNLYKNDVGAALGNYVNCSDTTQPGVPAIVSYLGSLPYNASPNCDAGHFYLLNNFFPGFHPDGRPASPAAHPPAADGSDFFFIPPSNVRTIGDALIDNNISWRYYGGGFNDAKAGKPNQFCPICNPMQYATSIMTDPGKRGEHLKDQVDLFSDIANDTVPAVSFVKPSGFLDGHPASSKLDLFEAFVDNIIDRVRAKPELYAETAIFIAFDEGGGYWDSGYIQPLDFFGDGVRIPFIVVSPFSRGGHVVHTYYDHVSILKFIERNWRLKPLTARSRDNLPNPVAHDDDPYVPRNSPAIGDLFDMFDFGRDGDHGDDRGDRDHG